MKVIEGTIPVDVYRKLRTESGLSGKTREAAEKGLKNSIYSVKIENQGEYIGMGRIIGDGVVKMIMNHLTRFIKEELPESCYVSLIADGDAFHLYEKFGFKDTLPESKGMFLKVT